MGLPCEGARWGGVGILLAITKLPLPQIPCNPMELGLEQLFQELAGEVKAKPTPLPNTFESLLHPGCLILL